MSWIRDLDNGRYQAIYRDGRKRQRSQTFDRKKDARAWLAQQQVNLTSGQWSDPRSGEVLFADFVKRWRAGRGVEPTTAASDAGRLKNHLEPSFGDWPLGSIRYLDVMEWMQLLKRKGLKPKTRRECLALMKMILDAAVVEGRIPANPAASVKPPPKVAPAKRKVTRAEVDAVLAAATNVSTRARMAIAAYGGVRWGEACGMRWGNVHLRAGRIVICETMEEIDGKLRRKVYPKDREERTIPIPAELAAILTEHRAACAARGAAGESDLVFPSAAGTPLYRSNNDRALDRLCRLAGVPALNYKDFRAFCASYLINDCGVPVTVVRELLGHSKASMTLDVYTDPPTAWHGDVVAAFARPFGVTDVSSSQQTADGLPMQATSADADNESQPCIIAGEAVG